MNDHGMASTMLFQGMVLLGAALGSVLLFRKLGLGAVLGYLVAGIAVGPFGLGLVGGDAESIQQVSEIGIVLLLFLVGLELSPRRLWMMRRDIFVLGPLQVALCGLAMFAVVLAAMNFTWQAALVLALPLGLSSTAQVLPLLQSRGRLKTNFGEKTFSILLFQDLSIVPLLTIVAVLSRAPVPEGTRQGWSLALAAVVGLIILVVAGKYLLSPLLKLVGRVSERELFVVTGLFAVCASAALMQYLGLSPALGAFIAGVMLAESPYRHELEADVDPFRSILLGLFFLSVGMLLNLDVVARYPGLIVMLAAVLVAVKTGIIFGLGRLFGLATVPALIMGLLLSQGGEFGFVLFAAAYNAQLISPGAASLFGAVVTLSMASTPFLMILANRMAETRLRKEIELHDPVEAARASVIVVGHGRFGQTTSQVLQAAGHSVTLIDIKPEQIDIAQEFGRKVFYGDGTRIDLLRRAGAEEARAIFFCIDDRDFDADAVEVIRQSFPDVALFARAYDRRQSLSLKKVEGLKIRREVIESAIALARDALEAFQTPAAQIDRIVAEYRRRDIERLRAQHEAGDMHAGSNFSFGGDDSDAFDPTEEGAVRA